MSDQFKVGDVVQLKSGGPAMTVAARCGMANESGARLLKVVYWNEKDGTVCYVEERETLFTKLNP